jgi:hypothetical protein
LSLGGGSKYLEIQGETPSHRLKPGLHTLRIFSFIRDAAGALDRLAARVYLYFA